MTRATALLSLLTYPMVARFALEVAVGELAAQRQRHGLIRRQRFAAASAASMRRSRWPSFVVQLEQQIARAGAAAPTGAISTSASQ